ncbi:MAG: serine/threonine protein phosphatase [Lachnospiraceae bacterium]|nr:serine/threonine protein phosphatase [Lachnospiraceae bacterium]
MATYVISDIHGEYDMFMELLEKIALSDADTLYVLGDMLDRGPHPIKVLQKIMEMPNVVCLVGNHELMALESLKFLTQEITPESIKQLDAEMLEGFLAWTGYNGGQATVDEFRTLRREEQKDVLEFLEELEIYEELTVAGKAYLLVHAGLGGYYPGKPLDDYTLKELVWDRAEYDIQYFENISVVTGHTPTQYIPGNEKPGFIFRQNNHVAIDCGAYIPGGRLAALCLETGEEFYVSSSNP